MSTTANSDSTLVAQYIKDGITIGGITGTLEILDTSDANATPEDLILGKTAYVNGKKITGTMNYNINISKTVSHVGYYADIDDDGTVDGIIYADLAIGGSGTWYDSNYVINKIDNIKDYYISQTAYEGDFGTKPVISQIKNGNENKNERFYIMALSDIDNYSHSWYNNAYGNIDYSSLITSETFGEGKRNTELVMQKWDKGENGGFGAQDPNDIWGLIKEQVDNGWFVPSLEEWAAFADQLKLVYPNYQDYGLNIYYWSSSQYSTTSYAWIANFQHWKMENFDVRNVYYVRLSKKF